MIGPKKLSTIRQELLLLCVLTLGVDRVRVRSGFVLQIVGDRTNSLAD